MTSEWSALMAKAIEREKRGISNHILEYPNGIAAEDLSNAENTLGFTLPEELKSLLMEFDGVHEYVITDDGEKIQIGSILWDLASIVDWHISWTIPNNLKLFCFGGSISGNCFGYLLDNGKPKVNEIWQGDHETIPPDEVIIWRASSLKDFITTSLAESRWY